MKSSADFAVEQLGQVLLTLSALHHENTIEQLQTLALEVEDSFDCGNRYSQVIYTLMAAILKDIEEREARMEIRRMRADREDGGVN